MVNVCRIIEESAPMERATSNVLVRNLMSESKVTPRFLNEETVGICVPSRVYATGGPSVCSAAHLWPAKAMPLR